MGIARAAFCENPNCDELNGMRKYEELETEQTFPPAGWFKEVVSTNGVLSEKLFCGLTCLAEYHGLQLIPLPEQMVAKTEGEVL